MRPKRASFWDAGFLAHYFCLLPWQIAMARPLLLLCHRRGRVFCKNGLHQPYLVCIGHGDDISETNGVINILRHEYGHTQQFEELGICNFTIAIANPSVAYNLLDRSGKSPYNYYSSPREYQADVYGGVTGRQYEPWAETACQVYFSLFNTGPRYKKGKPILLLN